MALGRFMVRGWLVLGACLLVLGVAAWVPSATASVPGPSAPGVTPAPSEPCDVAVQAPAGPPVPHPPVRIDGDETDESPTVGPPAGPGPPAYRPGSGIVAGNGTASDPYLIAGWRLPRVSITDTDAHFVVAANRFDPLLEPTGTWIDPDPHESPPGLQPHGDVGDSDVISAPNVSVVGNAGLQDFDVGLSPGFCFADNDVGDWARGLEVCQTPGISVVGNDRLGGIRLERSPHAYIEGNAFVGEGIAVGNARCPTGIDDDPRPFLDPLEPADRDHAIPPGNTLDGEPVRHVEDASGVAVTEPVGQVLVHNASNVTVHDANLTWHTEVSYSSNVTLRNVTAPFGAPIEAVETPRTRLLSSTLGSGVSFHWSPNATLRNNTGTPEKFELEDSPDSVVTGNDIEQVVDGVLVFGSSRSRVAGNTLEGGGVWLLESNGTDVRRNTIRPAGGAVIVTDSRHVTVANNTIKEASNIGGVISIGPAGGDDDIRVEHNLVSGTGSGRYGIASFVKGPDIWIEENVVRDFPDAGIYVHHDAASVEGNNLGDLETGVESDESVDATHNWWGCPEGPPDEDCSDASPPVVWDPPLTEPNPDAGPQT